MSLIMNGIRAKNIIAGMVSSAWTPVPTPANFGDPLEGGFYAGMIWNQITQSNDTKTLATGNVTFNVASESLTGLTYPGQMLAIRSRADPSNRFIGTVVSTTPTTLTMMVSNIAGWASGGGTAFSDWSVMSRFRVIVSPKATGENASVSGSLDDFNEFGRVLAATTLADGAQATAALAAVSRDTQPMYPAAQWCSTRSISGYDDWYLPARDEFELVYRNLKSVTTNNSVANRENSTYNYTTAGNYGDTGTVTTGRNRNSYPVGASYTLTDPAQTNALPFRQGGEQALDGIYHTSSDFLYDDAEAIMYEWVQNMTTGAQSGSPTRGALKARAVRRSVI